jgi:hypothetical protein
MTYGTLNLDVVQSSTTGVPTQFNDGSGNQIGTLCRAWVKFNGSSGVSGLTSFNVSSVTRSAAGTYVITMTTALADTNYAITVAAGSTGGNQGYGGSFSGPTSTTVFSIYTAYGNAVIADSSYVSIAVFR